jgi:hypothetical protein
MSGDRAGPEWGGGARTWAPVATVTRVSTPDRRGGAAGTEPDDSSWAAPPPTSVATPASGAAAASRGLRAAALAGVTAVTGYVFLLDPDQEGAYPLCPSRTLLGLDCPLCGGLRGTHALLHGRVGEALDHNVLLPGVLAVLAVMLGLWLLPLVGRPARRLPVPRWLGVAALALLIAFGVARNLPVDGLQYLASDA